MKTNLTAQEAAAKLGIGEGLVRRYIRQGRFGDVERFGKRSHSLTEAQVKHFIKGRLKPAKMGRPPKPVPSALEAK